MYVDLNVDMGEGFGMYSLGDDEGFMPFITSCNVACGFHAGDPVVMKKTVALAKKHGVLVGAHPGFAISRASAGERRSRQEELYCDLVYQIGALKAFLAPSAWKLHHVKTHGKLYGLAHTKEEFASDDLRGDQGCRGGAFLYCMKGAPRRSVGSLRHRPVFEACSDLDYNPEGNLVITRHHRSPSSRKARAPG